MWCHPNLVWLVFEGSIPTCICFHSENFFMTCSCSFLGMVRGKSGGRGGRGEAAWSVKYECTLLVAQQRTNSCCKCFQVKL